MSMYMMIKKCSNCGRYYAVEDGKCKYCFYKQMNLKDRIEHYIDEARDRKLKGR